MLNPTIKPIKGIKENYDNNQIYSEDVSNEIERLYKINPSNIWIAEQLQINISKVRRIIRDKNLKQYRVFKSNKPQEHYKKLNIRKKAYKDFRNELITQEELNKIIEQYPPNKKGRKVIIL